jgi:hypothetical protein
MKNIKDIRMLNKVLDKGDKALLRQIWNASAVPIEKKEAYIEMLMDKVNTPAPEADPVEEPVKTTTNYTPTSNNKFKTAKIGHNQPPQQPKRDPDIGPIVRPERTGWEQSKDSSGRSNKGRGPATIGTYDAPGVDLDAFPDGQDDYGVNTYSDYSSDGGGKIAHLQRRSEPLSNFDGPVVGGVDGQDDEQTKDTLHRDLDAFSDLTPDYIEDIETEYQNGANPNEIARTLSQTYGLPIASALKIVDNWVNFSTRRGAKSNANAKSIRQMNRIERNKKTGGRRFFQPKEKEEEEEDSENLNEFHKEYQMAVKKLYEISNSN